ncbi:MAG: PD-(D/E)XK nuclease family transposase [Bacilli bacterium]|nr:PD-(D/E)XK nuclease family transposase [Bacilli bacterium]
MTKDKYYTSMNEAVFYYCIGNDLNKAKIFIEQVIKKKISKIEMKNPKLLKDYMNSKDRTLDYLVLTDEGYINVEINNYYEQWRIDRDIMYACKVLTNSISKKKSYKQAEKIIQININSLGKYNDGIEVYRFNATNNAKGLPKVLSNIIEIYMVNIDYYKKMVYNGNKKFISDNYLLCAMDLQPSDLDNIKEGNEMLMEYKKDLEKINNDEDFVKWMSAEEEAEMFERTRIEIAEEKGHQQGFEQGKIEIAKKC